MYYDICTSCHQGTILKNCTINFLYYLDSKLRQLNWGYCFHGGVNTIMYLKFMTIVSLFIFIKLYRFNMKLKKFLAF